MEREEYTKEQPSGYEYDSHREYEQRFRQLINPHRVLPLEQRDQEIGYSNLGETYLG